MKMKSKANMATYRTISYKNPYKQCYQHSDKNKTFNSTTLALACVCFLTVLAAALVAWNLESIRITMFGLS